MINVVAGIIFQNNKVFCARRKQGLHLAGLWEFPGGKVENSESYPDALLRELREELAIDPQVGPYVGQSTYDYGEKVIRLHAYLCEADMVDLQLNDHDEICWLGMDELMSIEWAPADIPLLQQLKTFMYYQNSASDYGAETIAFSMNEKYHAFLEKVKNGGDILDLGCGSGRDSIAFKELGFSVTAIDPCPNIAGIASENINESVTVASCFNINFNNQFDGVWACASLLHCPKSELNAALENIIKSLKPNACAYVSLKGGKGEAFDENDRFFSYYTENEIEAVLSTLTDLKKFDITIETTPLRDVNQTWLNLILVKDEI